MNTISKTRLRLPASIWMLALGCGDDSTTQDICRYLVDPSECHERGDGDTGGGEAHEAGHDPGGEGEPDPGEEEFEPKYAACSLFDDGLERAVVQCSGELTASIAFETLLGDCGRTLGDPRWCEEVHEFGVEHEGYEAPAVMACCTPERAGEEVVLRYCAVDLVEQVCRSISKRLQRLLDEGLIKVGKGQARALRDYVASHQQDCFAALYEHGEVAGEIADRVWRVNGGDNRSWPSLRGFTITLERGAIESAWLPEASAEQITCADPDYNNTELFEATTTPAPAIDEVTRLESEAEVAVLGPEMFGAPVVGLARLAGADACVEPRCSGLGVRVEPGARLWTLTELELFAAAPVTLRSGELEAVVERAAVRLDGIGEGTIELDELGGEVHVIAPGAARLRISGAAERLADSRWATNASAIRARREPGGGWTLAEFELVHRDGAGDAWTLTIPATTWQAQDIQ